MGGWMLFRLSRLKVLGSWSFFLLVSGFSFELVYLRFSTLLFATQMLVLGGDGCNRARVSGVLFFLFSFYAATSPDQIGEREIVALAAGVGQVSVAKTRKWRLPFFLAGKLA